MTSGRDHFRKFAGMSIDLTNQKARAKQLKKKHKRLYTRLERMKGSEVDAAFAEADEKAFSCIDCLECANCCRTTGPLFNSRDISRISSHLGMSEADFESKYLRMDEEEDMVLQSVPCPFLDLETNMCGIYDVRPKACADYPHTHQGGQLKRKKLTLKDAEICPAVLEVLEALSSDF